MSNNFLGQIDMFGGNFAPRGWAFCNGQLMSIAQNSALFSLLGTAYGGDGVVTFALPNLQSCLPVHQGQGNGLSNYVLGQSSGSQNVTLTVNQIPSHIHTLNATQSPATTRQIGSTTLPGQPPAGNYLYAVNGDPPLNFADFNSFACSATGSNFPHSNLMPSLCITFIIALQGVFPSRN